MRTKPNPEQWSPRSVFPGVMSRVTLTRTHVEGHAAALMNQQGIMEATVYFNNPTIRPNRMAHELSYVVLLLKTI